MTFAAAAFLAAAPVLAQDWGDTPYVQTPQNVVDTMLEIAKIGPSDYVIDLGSGDGRMVITAAKKYGARGFGVDLDRKLVALANRNAARAGVADRAVFYQRDLHETDVSAATVMSIYLLPEVNLMIRTRLLSTLKPGTRIVSHDFDLGEWKPDRSVDVQTPEKYEISGSWSSTVHLWTVPAPVEGAWTGSMDGGRGGPFRLELKQRYQHFEGRLVRDAQIMTLREARLDGARIHFSAPGPDGRLESYTGIVRGGTIIGDARAGGGPATVRWSASRVR
jgi:hypothetical protein